ncbi:MAG: 16S rRNA (adenine(1518)-N(6)/adenine(1519)-N(6))-dimethyltransferase RsmA [Nitrospirota bacterium]
MKGDLRPRKSLGQCFLTDPRIAEKIVALGDVGPSDRVVEIGPGRGILTRLLVERAAEVTAIELDPRWTAALREEFAGVARLRVEQADALAYPFEHHAPGFKVIANLPYNISTPILFRLLSLRERIALMVLMLQREVVDRLLARPGTKAYGALSLAVAYAADVRKGFPVAAGSFSPRPAVESAVVVITPRATPAILVRDESMLMRVIRGAFSHRRKVLANALTDEGFEKPALTAALERAGIDPARRGETLSLEEFGRVADALVARTSASS